MFLAMTLTGALSSSINSVREREMKSAPASPAASHKIGERASGLVLLGSAPLHLCEKKLRSGEYSFWDASLMPGNREIKYVQVAGNQYHIRLLHIPQSLTQLPIQRWQDGASDDSHDQKCRAGRSEAAEAC